MDNCIALKGSIIGLPPPDIVESTFVGGLVSGIVNLTWIGPNIKMTSYANNGHLNGMFKAYDKVNNRWMIGLLTQNKLLKSSGMNCWIIEKEMVIFLSNCVI